MTDVPRTNDITSLLGVLSVPYSLTGERVRMSDGLRLVVFLLFVCLSFDVSRPNVFSLDRSHRLINVLVFPHRNGDFK